jgi:hypothetical protein
VNNRTSGKALPGKEIHLRIGMFWFSIFCFLSGIEKPMKPIIRTIWKKATPRVVLETPSELLGLTGRNFGRTACE